MYNDTLLVYFNLIRIVNKTDNHFHLYILTIEQQSFNIMLVIEKHSQHVGGT